MTTQASRRLPRPWNTEHSEKDIFVNHNAFPDEQFARAVDEVIKILMGDVPAGGAVDGPPHHSDKQSLDVLKEHAYAARERIDHLSRA